MEGELGEEEVTNSPSARPHREQRPYKRVVEEPSGDAEINLSPFRGGGEDSNSIITVLRD